MFGLISIIIIITKSMIIVVWSSESGLTTFRIGHGARQAGDNQRRVVPTPDPWFSSRPPTHFPSHLPSFPSHLILLQRSGRPPSLPILCPRQTNNKMGTIISPLSSPSTVLGRRGITSRGWSWPLARVLVLISPFPSFPILTYPSSRG